MKHEENFRRIQHDGYNHPEDQYTQIDTSLFDLSHSRLMTFDMGELVPMLNMEILPNDYIELKTDSLIRLAPLVAPLFHHLTLETRYYFVPNRLIWNEAGASFTDFITGGENGTDATVAPTFGATTYQEGSLADYLGIPIEVSLSVSALPFRAYNLIYNEFYRNEDVQTALTNSTNDGVDSTSNQALKNVNWSDAGDYFVGASETLQRGTAVTLPLGTSANVLYSTTSTNSPLIRYSSNNALAGAHDLVANASSELVENITKTKIDPNSTLYADLSTATAATIQSIREASATQILYELLQKGGSRYRNYISTIFGVTDYEDARFQIPEILGGKTSSVVVSEVLSTNGASGGALGQMGGHGIAPQQTETIKHKFKEHGILLGLMFVKPEAMYQEGLHKMWTRTARLDYAHPQLALIGDQPILNKELYAAHSAPTGTFAYQRRFAEYMSIPSTVHADFRSEADTPLEYWHLARDFAADPSFNSTFLTCDPDKARIFTSSSTDCVYAQIVHYITARRPIPKPDKPYKLI